jgi:hypothetical protein
VATGGNATSIATRSMASQPSEASITRTPDNQQTRDAECFPMDIDVDIEFDPAKQAGLHQSKHAPSTRAPRSEPVRTRSRAAASSQATSTPPVSTVAGKRQKTTAPEGDSEVSWNPPPSSSSVLAEINSNGSVARKASKPTAPGKENRMKRKHLEIDTINPATRGNRQAVRPTRSVTLGCLAMKLRIAMRNARHSTVREVRPAGAERINLRSDLLPPPSEWSVSGSKTAGGSSGRARGPLSPRSV